MTGKQKRKSTKIYLISETGAVAINYEQTARMFENIGYRRCTREEWRKKRAWQAREDKRAVDNQGNKVL